ncbi:MAG: hypothetical protein O7B26_08620, partial [Planctomycetota bacterium]|nr:hypothetical protein [Planctomycetota bacterium]
MQSTFAVFALFAFSLSQASDASFAARPESIHGADDGLFSYRFETGGLLFSDLLTLRTGSRRIGKVMEWADQILLFDPSGGMHAFGVEDVSEFRLRRDFRHLRKPVGPDLTVAFIERLPRDPSWHGRVHTKGGLPFLEGDAGAGKLRPAPGDEVQFRIHVLNAGSALSSEASCRVAIDGLDLKSASVPPLAPGRSHPVELTWPWSDSARSIQVVIESGVAAPEIVAWNNSFEEPVQGLGVTAIVARDRYDAFRIERNVVDSFCFEDWFQYQLRSLNALMSESVYPSAPNGILERVRCDRILVVDDPVITAWPVDCASVARFGPLEEGETLNGTADHVDASLLQSIGRDLGLIDLSATDTTIRQCMVRDFSNSYVQRRHLFPWPGTMMYTVGGFTFSEQSAGHLNKIRGRPRGFRGDYLYQLPKTIVLEVQSNIGAALENVEVDVFQLMSDGEFAGAIVGADETSPLFSAVTDAKGRVALPNIDVESHVTPNGYELRPNPFGKIALDGSNGLLMLRVRHRSAEEYHFVRLFDCNIAYLRGAQDEYVHRIPTRFATPQAPPSPAYTAILPRAGLEGEESQLYVMWKRPAGVSGVDEAEYRIYRRTSLGGNETKAWELFSVIAQEGGRRKFDANVSSFEEHLYHGGYTLDTFFAISLVDRQGRESGVSPVPAFVAYDKDAVAMAITPAPTHQVYISLVGDGASQILRYNGEVGTQPIGLRYRRFDGYEPSFGGLAIGFDRRLIIADPSNHVLGFYDSGDLVSVAPPRSSWPGFPGAGPGAFNRPSDVAVDGFGHILVADRGNNRVQVLDGRGSFLRMLDAGFGFDRPTSLCFANGHVCVTDQGGGRVRVYSVSEEETEFVRELPALREAGRALVARNGSVYVCGRDADTDRLAILVYDPEDRSARFSRSITSAEGEIGDVSRPRGLYLWDQGGRQFA